jgi:hypothetical protein
VSKWESLESTTTRDEDVQLHAVAADERRKVAHALQRRQVERRAHFHQTTIDAVRHHALDGLRALERQCR